MRRFCNRDIYARTPLRDLQEAQSRVALPDLQRCVGSHGLQIATTPLGPAPALPLLAGWVQLHVAGDRYAGDLVGAIAEPLPFTDDAFDVVWLRHALEVLPLAAQVLEEVIRVLTPGGTLMIAGVHPLGPWAPWFYWAARGTSYRLRAPLQLAGALRRAGLEVVSTRRVGHVWPTATRGDEPAGRLFGGGYILLARKQRRLVTPLRLRAVPLRVPSNPRLAPSSDARRGAAS